MLAGCLTGRRGSATDRDGIAAGATYTTKSYEASLQSAIDQAKAAISVAAA